jgi:ubiquinol-cytochrome c reductase subunit 8
MTFALSPNRQRPFAGAVTKGVFNTWRRFRNQVLYVAPPFIVGYALMQWAIERYVYNCGVGGWNE